MSGRHYPQVGRANQGLGLSNRSSAVGLFGRHYPQVGRANLGLGLTNCSSAVAQLLFFY